MAKKVIARKDRLQLVMDMLSELHREGKIYSLTKQEFLPNVDRDYVYVAFKIPIKDGIDKWI